MQKHFATLLAAATIGLVVGQASAADLPRKAPAYMPPPPPAFTWTGCYIGGNVGGAWANVEVTDVPTSFTASHSNSGFAGGGQIGCDYQMGAWVVGIRNRFDGTSIRETTPFFRWRIHRKLRQPCALVRYFDGPRRLTRAA
jgi:outer membrane immunogenic protein